MTLWKTEYGYRYRFQVNGHRYTKSGFKTKREAEAAQAKRRKEVKRGERNKTTSDTDFRTIAREYLDLAQRKFATSTYKQKVFVCKTFLTHTGNLPIEQITSSHLLAYLDTRKTNNNYNAHKKDLCTVFSFAKKIKRVITYNPCWDIENMPHTPEDKYIPPEADILKLIMAADPRTDEKDLILCLFYLIARIDEVLRLQWKDINFTKRTATRWTRKRKSGEYEAITAHMNEGLYQILKTRWGARKNEEWVFYNEKTKARYMHRPKLMKGLCKRAGVKHFGFHNIRHFVATHLADSEKTSKKTIGGLLGHKNLQTTEIYIHSVDHSERDALDTLYQKFGSRF